MADITPAAKKMKLDPHDDKDDDEVPKEIEDQCLNCHQSLGKLEQLLKQFLATPITTKTKLTDFENALMTLTLLYTINSMFWVYLTTQGVNPKDHSIKHELDRIQKYMHKANIIGGRLKGGKSVCVPPL
jgi:exosome complex protein LRP1